MTSGDATIGWFMLSEVDQSTAHRIGTKADHARSLAIDLSAISRSIKSEDGSVPSSTRLGGADGSSRNDRIGSL